MLVLGGPIKQLPEPLRHVSGESAGPASLHPLTVGIDQVNTGTRTFEVPVAGSIIHLAKPDRVPVLISWREGNGEIYWSADTDWLTNERIAQARNLELALRLLTPQADTRVGFDEYHHGYQTAERWWQILRGPLQLFLLYLTAAVALFYWAYGIRFGAPAGQPAGPPRAAVEYVYSMSQLYRRARATPMIQAVLYRNLTRELGRLIGGARGMEHGELARKTAPMTGLPEAEIRALLDRLSPEHRKDSSDAELIRLARETEELQRRVRHVGFDDQRRPGAGAS